VKRLQLLLRVVGCRVPRQLPSGLAARHTQVCLDDATCLLVWASVRVLGAGRVEQRSSGGCNFGGSAKNEVGSTKI